MTPRSLVIRYAMFAILATIANLAVQRVVLAIDDRPASFATAVFTGTLAGLALKYVLDKRWIFGDRSTGIAAHSEKFALYTLMGVATTALFWGTETAFWAIWRTEFMREAGALLGLAVGYVVKYHLDRRFVFNRRSFAEGWHD